RSAGGGERLPSHAPGPPGTAAAGSGLGKLRAGGRVERPHQGTGVTMDLTLLPDGGMSWLDASGPESHIVLSTRVRLARNLSGMSFTVRSPYAERETVLEVVAAAGRQTRQLKEAALLRMDVLDRADRQVLHERHLVSKELAGLERESQVRRGSAVLTSGDAGVMINEEDHLRLQCLRSGLALSQAYADLERLDAELGTRLPFAFHP